MSLIERLIALAEAIGTDIKTLGAGATQQEAEQGTGTEVRTWSPQRVWQAAAAWFYAVVVRTGAASGAFASKQIGLDFQGGAGSPEQASALRVASSLTGRSSVGGWLAGLDLNQEIKPQAQADKVYGSASYFQLGAGASVDKLLGYEFVINNMASGATVGVACGFYVPNLTGVPNITNVGQFYAFGSDMPGAAVRIAGPYLRVNEVGLVQELAPSSAGLLNSRLQWCIGRQGWAEANQSSLPAGVLCIGAIYLPRKMTITSLSIYLQTGATGNGRLAIYRQSSAGMLGQKAWQSGNIPTSGAGNKTATLSLTLEAGLYFAAFIANTAVGIRVKPNSMVNTIFGTESATDESCVPYWSLGSYPANLPNDASSSPPSGYLPAYSPEFNFIAG